jgi:hypothetical protein
MVGAAKRAIGVYEDMIRAGYKGKEFAVWWYSPARDETSQ